MKRILIIFIFLALTCTLSHGTDWVTYSAPLTADGQFCDKNGDPLIGDYFIYGFSIETDGNVDTSIEIYDGTSTGGSQIAPKFTVIGTDNNGEKIFPMPIPVSTGLYGDITTTNGNVQIYYRNK